MDIDKIKVFLNALESGSFSSAAENLAYTVSGVSRAVVALEEETGFPLLIRSRSGVVPTPDCRRLIPYLEEIARQSDLYMQMASDIQGFQVGNLVLGTAYSIYYPKLTKLILDFNRRYPGVRVEIIEDLSANLGAYIEKSKADFCIMSRRQGAYRWRKLFDDQLMALVLKKHPAVSAGKFSIQRFEKEPFIVINPAKTTDNMLFFARNGIRPNIQFTTQNGFAARSLVEAGMGVSLINRLDASHSCGDALACLPLDPPQSVEIGVAYPSQNRISPAADCFFHFAEAYFPELML